MLFSPSHLAGEIVNASEHEVKVWGKLAGPDAGERIDEARQILRRFPFKSANEVAAELFDWARGAKLSLAASRQDCFSLETTGDVPATGVLDPDTVYEYPGTRMTLLLQGSDS